MRALLNGHGPLVIWFTGLSGSGKSTLAGKLEERLHNQGIHTYLLDGDNVRGGLNRDLDFSERGRTENIRRVAEVCGLFADAGIVVITAFVSPFQADREFVRRVVGDQDYFEIFVNCPIEVCEERDVKGLYRLARAGEIKDFTGVSSPYEYPKNPDLEIDTSKETVEFSIEKIYQSVMLKLKKEK
jgi:adenylylsulfate kinase